jgi:two-component system response regulator
MRNIPTILVVDDDPADQFLVQEAMRTANLHYSLQLVSDGEEAIEYLYHRGRYAETRKAPRPDLILLDLNMPRMNGRQVARAIKSDPNFRAIPIVVLTTSRLDQDVDELYQAGVNSYIQKPANFDEFTEALRDLSAYWLGRATLPAGPR